MTANQRRAHTPGPWRIGDAKNTVFGPPDPRKPSPQTIAHLGVIDHEANGRLIAAAPDLLEALKNAVKVLDRHVPDSLDLIESRAAIAKAEGGK